jgi:Xaa-Pro aminopeptidase
VDELLSYDELEITRLARELKSGAKAYAAHSEPAGEARRHGFPIAVPPGLGVVYADELRARGVTLTPDRVLFEGLRRSKTERRSPTSRGPRPPSRRPAPRQIHPRRVRPRKRRLPHLARRAPYERAAALEIDVDLLRRGLRRGRHHSRGRSAGRRPARARPRPLKAGESIIVDIFPWTSRAATTRT